MPVLERVTAYQQSCAGVGSAVSLMSIRTTASVREGVHVSSISPSASASGSVAVSSQVSLMTIQSVAYWHQ